MNRDVEFIVQEALELASPYERKIYLDKICVDAPELRKQVDKLLHAHDHAQHILERAHNMSLAELMGTRTEAALPAELDVDKTCMPKNKPILDDVGCNQIAGQPMRRFGDYELLEKIAHGGMGVVYRARQVSLNRTVAIKMILAGQFASDDDIKRFQAEAEAAAHLDHPGIVPVFDVGCCEGHHFFSMGYVDGKSLAQTIQDKPISFRAAAELVRKISVAMQAAHDRGIVHRDLKPGNVLVDEYGEPRVTDFGLAKQVEGDSQLTTSGMVLGTPSYMPPEQARGEPIDAVADVYSLGAILYSLLTRKPPFEGEGQVSTLVQVIHDEPVGPRKIVAGIPRDLEAICLKCLEKDRQHRYPTAAELANDLRRFLAGEPISARNDLARRFRKWTIREPVLAAQLVTTLTLVLVVFVNYLLFAKNENPLADIQKLLIYQTILATSAITAIVLQKIHNALRHPYVVPILWAALNPGFVTVAICISSPPRGILFSTYLLLMITISFFRRIDLTIVTTISSIIGFSVILMFFPEPTPIPSSYKVVFTLTLIVSGTLLGFLALRLKRLGQQHSI